MMLNEKPSTKALKHARNKGLVLETLMEDYPEPIDFKVLHTVLETHRCTVSQKTLFGYIVYLNKSGYISYSGEKDTYNLTLEIENKGVNLLDGFVQDATILLKG